MATMVIEVPAELKGFGEAVVEAMAEVKRTIGRAVGGKALGYDEVECAIADCAAEIVPVRRTASPGALTARYSALHGTRHQSTVGRSGTTLENEWPDRAAVRCAAQAEAEHARLVEFGARPHRAVGARLHRGAAAGDRPPHG